MTAQRRRNAPKQRARINQAIRVPEVRLLGTDGTPQGIVKIDEALTAARSAGLDLVEIAPTAKPPVCRILSYSKWCYQQERQEKAKRQKQQDVKLIKFGVRIGESDLQTKCRKIRELLGEGDKVRVVLAMKGRELAHPELADKVLALIAAAVGDDGRPEAAPRREGRNVFVTYLPVK
jgi:translation initiation factor IF-3